MKRAVFIVDDRPEAGLGHVVRCGALADELRARGWETSGPDPRGTVPDVVVIDHPDYDGDEYARVMKIVDTVPERVLLGVDLLVCGSAGATPAMFEGYADKVLAGPEYALLRQEFREAREWGCHCVGREIPGILDLRDIKSMTAAEVAGVLASGYYRVIAYGGMRAMEAACVVGAAQLEIYPRNSGEGLNARGLAAGAVVDGLGCKRVADAIEELVQ